MAEVPAASSILVIVVSRIGDTLLATPALRAIAHQWPGAELTCLAHPKRAEILENLEFLHRVGSITKHRARLLGRFGKVRFDLAFVYGHDQPLVEYALRVAARVVAFRQEDEGVNRRLYRVAALPGFQDRHAVHYRLALLAPLEIPPCGLSLAYRIRESERQWAKVRLGSVRNATAGPLVGLQIASFPTKGYRDWPIERFIELCGRIRSGYPGTHFVIFGGKEEHERTSLLHQSLSQCSSLYAGRLTLRQTAALMGELDLYVGVDTGPTHIMGALHRPMVVLYHAHSPSRLLAPLEHPCLHVVDHPQAGANAGPEAPMDAIPVDRVWSSVRQALEHHYAVPGR